MKICLYCGASCPDDAMACASCGAREFDYICENCKTQFHSGYCPNCGVKAGEKPRVCPNCGEKSFGTYCPDCGHSLIPQSHAEPAASATPMQTRAMRTSSSSTIVGMVVLTVFLPFVGAWILLMDDRYGRGYKIFALVYCLIMSVTLLVQRSWAAGVILFAPIVGYGIKFALERRKTSA